MWSELRTLIQCHQTMETPVSSQILVVIDAVSSSLHVYICLKEGGIKEGEGEKKEKREQGRERQRQNKHGLISGLLKTGTSVHPKQDVLWISGFRVRGCFSSSNCRLANSCTIRSVISV